MYPHMRFGAGAPMQGQPMLPYGAQGGGPPQQQGMPGPYHGQMMPQGPLPGSLVQSNMTNSPTGSAHSMTPMNMMPYPNQDRRVPPTPGMQPGPPPPGHAGGQNYMNQQPTAQQQMYPAGPMGAMQMPQQQHPVYGRQGMMSPPQAFPMHGGMMPPGAGIPSMPGFNQHMMQAQNMQQPPINPAQGQALLPGIGGFGRPPSLANQSMMMQPQPAVPMASPLRGPAPATASNAPGEGRNSPTMSPVSKAAPRPPNLPFAVNARRFAVESFTGTGRCNFAKASLKKSSECFFMDRRKNALVCQGPKRSKFGTYGCAVAYANSGALVAISESAETGDDYLSWLRKRLRIDTLGDIEFRVVNIGVQGTVEKGKELRVAEFYLVLMKWFSHWTTIYNPDISPYLTITRSPPRDPALGVPKMPPHMIGALRPVEIAVYETLSRETAEDINYAQILAHSGVAPTAPVGTSPDADAYLHSTGRSAVYLVDASSLSIHRVQEEHEMYAAWAFIMPLISCFLESCSPPKLYTTLITP